MCCFFCNILVALHEFKQSYGVSNAKSRMFHGRKPALFYYFNIKEGVLQLAWSTLTDVYDTNLNACISSFHNQNYHCYKPPSIIQMLEVIFAVVYLRFSFSARSTISAAVISPSKWLLIHKQSINWGLKVIYQQQDERLPQWVMELWHKNSS